MTMLITVLLTALWGLAAMWTMFGVMKLNTDDGISSAVDTWPEIFTIGTGMFFFWWLAVISTIINEINRMRKHNG